MKERTLFITELDRQKLQDLLEADKTSHDRDKEYLQALACELKRAQIVASGQVPANVVTLNSKVQLRDVESDTLMEVTLVLPEHADLDAGMISVLSPVGTAILGYAEGDTITWMVPAGNKQFVIEKLLYQPEAAGA